MPYDFIKITDVDLMEKANEGTTVMVEDNGELKRVPKSSIGAQADWNETDASNSAFILNKPTKMGEYQYYYYQDRHLYKCDDYEFDFDPDARTLQTQFEEDYYSYPILLNIGSYISPMVSYSNSYGTISYVAGTSLEEASVSWYYGELPA